MHPRSGAVRVLASLFLIALAPAALAQYVTLVGGKPPVQDFDTLAASGTATTLPDGWYLAESGSNADTSYTASDGAANSGDTYSYGASGSGERAFGSLRSGSLVPMIGAPAARSPLARFNGVCPPNWTIRPWTRFL